MQTVLIYCEGGTFGLGHVKRQIVLARELQRRGVQIEFVSPFSESVGVYALADSGYTVNDSLALAWPAADALIVDVEEYPSLSDFDNWKDQYPRVILFGGAAYPRSDRENLIDLTVYQGEPFDNPSSANVLNGLEYVIVDPDFSACHPKANGHILISMGGRDPYNFTPLAMRAANTFARKVVTIIGPQFDSLTLKGERTEIVVSPTSLVSYLDSAALCVCATGMTAYESLCAGVPCVLGNISEDHERTAQELDRLGVAVNLGQTHEFTVERCAHGIDYFLNGRLNVWPEISCEARSLIDGRGVERVAYKIEGLLNG